VRKWISDLRLGPSTRLRLAQDDAGRQFEIGSRRGSDFEIFDLLLTIWDFWDCHVAALLAMTKRVRRGAKWVHSVWLAVKNAG
jgi:hypothetical protein